MQVKIYKGKDEVYDGNFNINAMANSIGISELSEESAPVNEKLTVIFNPREDKGCGIAAAKLINYAHILLQKQGVETDIDYAVLRKQLIEKPDEVCGPWQLTFSDSDSMFFFIGTMRHTDMANDPKWQVWATKAEDAEKGYDEEHFLAHSYKKISRNYLVQLTGAESPNAPEVHFMEGVRKRVGKTIGLIKATRAKITDEEKRQRAVAKIKDEDKALCPDEYAKVEAGEMEISEFKQIVKSKKNEQKAQARAARKATSGEKAAVKKPSKEVDP
jgi:hypothetical protein